MMPPWTRIHSSLVAQPCLGVALVRARTALGVVVDEALHRSDGPSSACTTSSIAISSAGRASHSRRVRRERS